MTTTHDTGAVYGPALPTYDDMRAYRRALLADRLAELRERPLSFPTDGSDAAPTVDDYMTPTTRQLWSAGDARHTLELDRWADDLLNDDAWIATNVDQLVTLEPRQRDAAMRHAVRDTRRGDGIAVNVTGYRRANRVGSGRSAKVVRGGYVERSYSAIVHSPRLSAKRLATVSLDALAELGGLDAATARHTTSLATSAVAYGHRLAFDPTVYRPTRERTAVESRLRWSPRLKARTAAGKARHDVTVPDVVTYHRTDRAPSLAVNSRGAFIRGECDVDRGEGRHDRTTHAATFAAESHASDAAYRARSTDPVAPIVGTVGDVVECVGPWIDAARREDGTRRYWHGHSVRVSIVRPRKAVATARDREIRDNVEAIVAAVLADRRVRSTRVGSRLVTIRPFRGGVRWQSTSRSGQGKSARTVAGRIVAACKVAS